MAHTSNEWVSFGLSQGGQGAWAANELSGNYGSGPGSGTPPGSGTALVGSVSLAPPLDLVGFVDAAADGTLTKEQVPAYQALLAALKNEHPAMDLDQYRRGIVVDAWNTLLQCDFSKADERANIIDRITPDDLIPASVQATDELREYLRQESLPSRPYRSRGWSSTAVRTRSSRPRGPIWRCSTHARWVTSCASTCNPTAGTPTST